MKSAFDADLVRRDGKLVASACDRRIRTPRACRSNKRRKLIGDKTIQTDLNTGRRRRRQFSRSDDRSHGQTTGVGIVLIGVGARERRCTGDESGDTRKPPLGKLQCTVGDGSTNYRPRWNRAKIGIRVRHTSSKTKASETQMWWPKRQCLTRGVRPRGTADSGARAEQFRSGCSL